MKKLLTLITLSTVIYTATQAYTREQLNHMNRSQLVAAYKEQYPTASDAEIKKLNMLKLKNRIVKNNLSTDAAHQPSAEETQNHSQSWQELDWHKICQQLVSFDTITITTSLQPETTYTIQSQALIKHSSIIRDLLASEDHNTLRTTTPETIKTRLHPLLLAGLAKEPRNTTLTLDLQELTTLIDQAIYLGRHWSLFAYAWETIKTSLQEINVTQAQTALPQTVDRLRELLTQQLWLPQDQDHETLQTNDCFSFLAEALERNYINVTLANDADATTYFKLLAEDPTMQDSLDKLTIKSCPGITTLGQLTTVNQLTIDSCNALTSLGHLRTVNQLTIVGCNSFQDFGQLTTVNSLEIWDCPALTTLGQLTRVDTLKIVRCITLKDLGQLTTVNTLEILYCPTLATLGQITTVNTLRINLCPALATLGQLTTVNTLKIYDCRSLTTLGQLTTVNQLLIRNCRTIATLGKLTTVDQLSINNCNSFQDFGQLTTVNRLWIFCCRALTSLGHLTRVNKLEIYYCDALTVAQTLIDQLGENYIREL